MAADSRDGYPWTSTLQPQAHNKVPAQVSVPALVVCRSTTSCSMAAPCNGNPWLWQNLWQQLGQQTVAEDCSSWRQGLEASALSVLTSGGCPRATGALDMTGSR